MTKQRPTTLVMVSFVLVGIAIAMPIQIMVLYEHGLGEMSAVLDKLTWLNWAVSLGGLITAHHVFHASRWARISVPVLIVLVALNNLAVANYGVDYSPQAAHLATVGFVFLNLPLLQPRIFSLFQHPEQRGWRMAHRELVTLPVLIDNRDASLRAETFDISTSGAFVKWEGLDSLGPEGRPVRISIRLSDFQSLRVRGRIVRRTRGQKGRYPPGIGVEFTQMSMRQRIELRKLVPGI